MMQSLVNVTRLAPVFLVMFVGASGCTSRGFEEDQSRTRTSVQGLTPDEECTRMEGTGAPLFSGTHNGGGNGTVDLGNGETATISNSDGVSFDWSATTAIRWVIVRGSPQVASVYPYNPAAMSGNDLSAPKDSDDQDRQLPLTTIKFCYPAEGTPPSPDAGGSAPGSEESGGGKSW